MSEENFNKQLATSPQTAAKVIVNGIVGKKARILIGKDAKVMDWLARLLPVSYSKVLLNQLLKRGLLND